jgi:nicotinate-nucleotide adenylyltransferase
MLGEDYKSLVPKNVFDYINEHDLYNLSGQIPHYKQLLKSSLSEKRYNHSLNVADSAVYLASKYGANKNKAYFAGLMHDITKEKNENEQLQIINDFAIIYDDAERNNKALWHAITGAWYLQNVLNIKDTEIIKQRLTFIILGFSFIFNYQNQLFTAKNNKAYKLTYNYAEN